MAQLPTGKVLLFSFERIETNPTKETAPTRSSARRTPGGRICGIRRRAPAKARSRR
ncbi:hypothetical protein NKH18_18405 [Streptomyces sp. M10(2022)]